MSPSRKTVKSGARAVVLAAAVLSLGACTRPLIEAGDFGRTVSTSQGDVLVAANGDTLYTYEKDTPGHPACTGACTVNWPPAVAGPDAEANGNFSIITRPDGTHQWAYKGKPLYTYTLDGGPGAISGDDVNGVWHLAKP